MKLYTEEQVNRAIELARTDDVYYPTKDEIVNTLTPIAIPSDEEIENESLNYDFTETFNNGAKWMRDKILNKQ